MPLVTFGISEDSLAPDDQPSYCLFSEKDLTLQPTDAFAFGADVHPGYFHLKVENTSGKGRKMGQGPNAQVRIAVTMPTVAWSKVVFEDISIGSMVNGTYNKIFSVHSSARLEVFILHNGKSQPKGFRNCHVELHINSCHSKDEVGFTTVGIQPTAVVEQWWNRDRADTLPTSALSPTPVSVAEAIQGRHSFTVTSVGHSVFIFGGDDGTRVTNQLLEYNVEKSRISCFGDMFNRKDAGVASIYTGVPPGARAGHSACVWNGRIVYFGGFNSNHEAVADVHTFHINESMWYGSEPNGTGSVSIAAWETVPRGYHSTVVHDNCLWIMGGCVDYNSAKSLTPTGFATTGLWKYHLLDRKWSQAHTNLPYGGKVYGHSAVMAGNKMFVFGGVEERRGLSQELHALDMVQMVWIPIQVTSKGPSKRAFPCLWALDSGSDQETTLAWPTVSLRNKPSRNESEPLQAIFIFGGYGDGKANTTEGVHMLTLNEFRGHSEGEWSVKSVAEPMASIVEAPVASAGPSGSFFDKMERKMEKMVKERGKTDVGTHYSSNPLIGSSAVVIGDGGILDLLLFGLGPPTSQIPTSIPPSSVIRGICPFDCEGYVTTKGMEVDTEEDKIAVAFSEFEKTVEELQSTLPVVLKLKHEKGLEEQYEEACEGMYKGIKKANKLMLKFPTDAFGSKGDDLLQVFSLVLQKWNFVSDPEGAAKAMETAQAAQAAKEAELAARRASQVSAEAQDSPTDRSSPVRDGSPTHLRVPSGHGTGSPTHLAVDPPGHDRVFSVDSNASATSSNADSNMSPGLMKDRFVKMSASFKKKVQEKVAEVERDIADVTQYVLDGTVTPLPPPNDEATIAESPSHGSLPSSPHPSGEQGQTKTDDSEMDMSIESTSTAQPSVSLTIDSTPSTMPESTKYDPAKDTMDPNPPVSPSTGGGSIAQNADQHVPSMDLSMDGVSRNVPPLDEASFQAPELESLSKDSTPRGHKVVPFSIGPAAPFSSTAAVSTTPTASGLRAKDTPTSQDGHIRAVSPLWSNDSHHKPNSRTPSIQSYISGSSASGGDPAYLGAINAVEAQLGCLQSLGPNAQGTPFHASACRLLHQLLEQAQSLTPNNALEEKYFAELLELSTPFLSKDALDELARKKGNNQWDSAVSSVRSSSQVQAVPMAIDAEDALAEFEVHLSKLEEQIRHVKALTTKPQGDGTKRIRQLNFPKSNLNPSYLLKMGTRRRQVEDSRRMLRELVNKCSQLSKALPSEKNSASLLDRFGLLLSEAHVVY